MGLGYSHNYYLPERVAFCLMFTYRDADVILKMELIFKRRSKGREENKSWLSPFPQSATLAEVPFSSTSGKRLSFGLFHHWPKAGDTEIDQSFSKTQCRGSAINQSKKGVHVLLLGFYQLGGDRGAGKKANYRKLLACKGNQEEKDLWASNECKQIPPLHSPRRDDQGATWSSLAISVSLQGRGFKPLSLQIDQKMS